MKINFVLPFYSVRPIGGLKVAYEYANQLSARGHDVTVIHPRLMKNVARPNGLRKLQTAALDARNLLAPRAGLKWQPLDDRVRVLIVREPTAAHIPDGDVIFATAWQTSEYVRDCPSSKGTKFYLVMDFEPWIAAKEVLEKTWALPLKKITISNWLYEKVIAAGCSTSEVANIPIGVNFDQFHLKTDPRTRGRTLLMMYSSSPSKGSEFGLSAISAVRESHPDLQVVFFGSTMRRRPPQLPRWVDYFGNVTNKHLDNLYNSSTIYVCSSWAEGFALPPAEAMACGCALAATDCGGTREFVVDGVNALSSPPGDVSGLARNINLLLDNDLLRIRLAEAGHRSIQSFTWAAATDKLESLITSHANGSGERNVMRAARA